MRQLLLELIPPPLPSRENFVVGANAAALAGLAAWLAGSARPNCLFLWGEQGAGKSHLLRAVGGCYADAATDPDLAAVPADAPTLAVDNVAALGAAGQVALFNHFNRLQQSAGRLLAAGRLPPAQLDLREDLRTRLGSGPVYRLQPLDDAQCTAALAEAAQQRGMNIAPEALSYLQTRAPRDMRSLTAILAALDRYSLERQRPLTLPLLREVLHASALQP